MCKGTTRVHGVIAAHGMAVCVGFYRLLPPREVLYNNAVAVTGCACDLQGAGTRITNKRTWST